MTANNVPLKYDSQSDGGALVAFADVVHGFEAAGGCAAALLIVNEQSEPVEFVFNCATPGCRRLPMGALWGAGLAARVEARVLLRSLFDRCIAAPSVLVIDEAGIDARLIALDLRVGVPSALVRGGTTGVARWLPARPPDHARRVIGAVLERTTLVEVMGRVRRGLDEAYMQPEGM
jgi:hypothetical protein